jgi:hypothetical protein
MKNILNRNLLKTLLVLAVTAPFFTSCEEDVEGAPTIERVSIVEKDSTTQEGLRGETYVIYGTNLSTTRAVYFNGAQAPLNTTLVSPTHIIIRIGANTPYIQATNKVRVVTAFGEASLDFLVRQLPVVLGFAPAVAGVGETVTINGGFFDDLQSVTFTNVDGDANPANDLVLPAEVISATTGEIKVKVPVGAKVSRITVTTSSGKTTYANSFGFNYIIYTDRLADGWEDWGWSRTSDLASTTKVKSGSVSYKHTYTGAWGGVSFRHAPGIRIGDYTSVKFSIFGGPGTAGKVLNILIDGQSSVVPITLKEEWTDYTIPLSQLGSPDLMMYRLNFQDKGDTAPAAPYLMYIDDVGFL